MCRYFRARTLLFSIIAPNTHQFLANFSAVSQQIALIVTAAAAADPGFLEGGGGGGLITIFTSGGGTGGCVAPLP